MKCCTRVRPKPSNNRCEFELDRARRTTNIAENPFALGHETDNNQPYYCPVFIWFDPSSVTNRKNIRALLDSWVRRELALRLRGVTLERSAKTEQDKLCICLIIYLRTCHFKEQLETKTNTKSQLCRFSAINISIFNICLLLRHQSLILKRFDVQKHSSTYYNPKITNKAHLGYSPGFK